jgi:ketosteroid isomerase-like protein
MSMKQLRIGVVAMVVMMVAAPRVRADAALDSLVAYEKAFADMASAKGIKPAFLTYLSEEAVVFQPTATNGRKAWEARPETKATLLWEPSYAQVSSSGDLGFTTGPFEFHPAAVAVPADTASHADSTGARSDSGTVTPPVMPQPQYLYGQFNSVWKKVGDVWRVVLDIGVTHTKPSRSGIGSGEFEPGASLPRRTMKSARVKLAGLDEKLSQAMRKSGGGPGFALHAAENVRLNTDGYLPAKGVEEAQARVDSVLVGFFEFKPEGSGVAKAGDLGYTYGTAIRYASEKGAPADTSVYLHVWRLENGVDWRVALAVWNKLGTR